MDEDLNEKMDYADDVMNATFETMKEGAMGIKTEEQRLKFEDTKKYPGGKISPSDLRDYQNAYMRSLEHKRTYWILAYILGIIKSLSAPNNETQKGQCLAIISKKIGISDSGDIIRIELEPWGRYILHYIGRIVPEYINRISKYHTDVSDHQDDFLSFKPVEAGKKF